MRKFRWLGGTGVLLMGGLFCALFSSCVEKISTIGNAYLHDTVTAGVHTFSDSSTFLMKPIVRRTITANGLPFEINRASTVLFFGKVASENLEIWAAMKMPILPDSIGQVLTDTLILRMRFAYEYGVDPNIKFQVYTETNNAVNDATTNLTPGNLGTVVGSFQGTVVNDSIATMTIPLDTSIINPLLRTASLALVVVPDPSMNAVRTIASTENGDNTYSPQLHMAINVPNDTIIRYPTNDFHIIVHDDQPPPQGTFFIRGSYARREHIVVNIKHIRDFLGLNPFTTINSALLEFRSLPQYRTVDNYPLDTVGPSLAYIPDTSVADSSHYFVSYGTNSTGDTTLYGFEIRTYIEQALRRGLDTLVLELRSGFVYQPINGSTIDVESTTIDRWGFYGMDATDPTKRPKVIVAYSYLK